MTFDLDDGGAALKLSSVTMISITFREKFGEVTGETAQPAAETPQGRRSFLFWLIAALAGTVGLFGAFIYKVICYVQGPKLTAAKTAELLKQEAALLAQESRLINLKLERINNTRIAVAKLSELSEDRGQLCTDFFLQPAMVLKTGDESCIARSAVCTHLGCTVQTELVDGKIYCPCHVSYFDVATGKPLAGPAPYALAEEPLVIEGDLVYLVKPPGPIKIGPTQMPMNPL